MAVPGSARLRTSWIVWSFQTVNGAIDDGFQLMQSSTGQASGKVLKFCGSHAFLQDDGDKKKRWLLLLLLLLLSLLLLLLRMMLLLLCFRYRLLLLLMMMMMTKYRGVLVRPKRLDDGMIRRITVDADVPQKFQGWKLRR